MAYVLGVDGGNSKTDYLLHDTHGRLVGHLRAGTCSHEAIGMEGARREMGTRIAELLAEARVSREEVAGAAFGLAGIDQPIQQADLTRIIHELGFLNSIAMNDSFLGIKAGSESGIGVSSVNGTGTSAGGIDAEGNWMQVGGIGPVSGDDAGGNHLALLALRAVYQQIYRFGPKTSLTPVILSLFDCENPEDFHLAYSLKYQFGDVVKPLQVVQALLEASTQEDAVARAIVLETADTMARSSAGCAVRLRFGDIIPVVLIGSVWTKGRHQPMIDHFKAQFERYTSKAATLHVLSVPPAAGSVLWALELALGHVPDAGLRQRVLEEVAGV